MVTAPAAIDKATIAEAKALAALHIAAGQEWVKTSMKNFMPAAMTQPTALTTSSAFVSATSHLARGRVVPGCVASVWPRTNSRMMKFQLNSNAY
jgi:hypothetical protein